MNEDEFLKNYNIHDFDLPLTTVDVVIFTVLESALQVLLVKRGKHPFLGQWALPGGFIDVNRDKDLEAVALRKLKEKTALDSPYLEPLQGWGSASRDPRGWSVTLAYFALVPAENALLQRGVGVDEARWWPIQQLGVQTGLAFDHGVILEAAVTRLQNKVEYTSLPIHLLPREFTLADLQHVYEVILGRAVDKSAFRKRITHSDSLEILPGKFRLGSNRPAQLYRANQDNPIVFFQRTFGLAHKQG